MVHIEMIIHHLFDVVTNEAVSVTRLLCDLSVCLTWVCCASPLIRTIPCVSPQ